MKFPSTVPLKQKAALAENPEKMRNTHTHFLIKETILVGHYSLMYVKILKN